MGKIPYFHHHRPLRFRLESAVNDVSKKYALHVVDYTLFGIGEERTDIELGELLVAYTENNSVKLAFELVERFVGEVYAVLMFDGCGIGPRVVNGDVGGVLGECMIDVYNLGVADVGAVLFEGDAKYQNLCIFHLHTLEVHALDCLIGNVCTHAIVETASREHHSGQYAIDLRFLYKVIGVNRNAVTADQARRELDEVPLRRGSFDNVVGVNAHGIEYLGQFVHKGDVYVTLRVLDDFRRLGDLD